MKKIITSLYNYFEKHPLALRITLSLTILALIGCILHIKLVEDISRFLPEKEDNARINYAYQHIGAANKIMINIAAKDTSSDYKDLITQAAEELNTELRKNDTLHIISELFYKIDQDKIMEMTQFIIQNMPYYLNQEDYLRMDTLLTPDNIRQQMAFNRGMMFSPAGGFMKNIIGVDPLHFSNSILSQLQEIQAYNNYTLHNGYVFTKEGNEAMISIACIYPATETLENKMWIQNIENSIDTVEAHFNHEIKISSIGAAIISIGNADQIKKDSLVSTSIALFFILLLLMLFYKDIRALFIILFSISFGLLFGLAFLVLIKDAISIIAIGIGSIIVGIAVNYPLHFLAHYQQGYTKEETIRDIINPLVTGNITTVGAFLSLIFISSDAMRDTGLFAALLLIGTILFVLIFLPHLFRKSLFRKQKRTENRLLFGKIADFNLEKNKIVVFIILFLTIPLYYFSTKTQFETDLNTINYMTPDVREKLNKLIAETESGNPKIYCVSDGKTIDKALESYEKAGVKLDSLLSEKRIIKKSGISIFLPSKKLQEERIAQWNKFWKEKGECLDSIQKIGEEAGFSATAFDQFKQIVNQSYTPQDIQHFEPIVSSFANNYLSQEENLSMVYTLLETSPENKDKIQEELNNIDANIFAFDNGSLLSKMIDALSDDFDYVLYICGIIVFLFLTISFGRMELSCIAFIPLAVSWIWILGLMDIFDMKFNIVNIILATFIFGQGDDYTIFVTEGLMYEYTYRKKMLASYKNSVMLSASIMFIGIGALIFAKHPAMRSLAEVTIVGMFSVILMAYLFPPLLYRWLTSHKGENRLMPITFRNLFITILAFFVFLFGTIYLSLVGLVLLTIGGKSNKHKLTYHKQLCGIFRLLIKIMPKIDCHINNAVKETFEKPGIIICNHQSHLDLMYTLMLNPKIICLTNKWVWNCPFYGWIIRYADFHPLSDGIEGSEAVLQKAIDDGYSILIFPEGTRSEDCSILRFHQGAFHLAKMLNTDIIPIMIHGIGHIFPKKEFILRKGRVDVKILPRITPSDPIRNNVENLETAQLTRQLYIKEYEKMCLEIEDADYYADLVYHNYIYKGAEIARKARLALKKNHNFKKQIAALPDSGTYHIESCGQGEFALLAALVKKNLVITAIDEDEENILLAKNCTSVPENLHYVYTEVINGK